MMELWVTKSMESNILLTGKVLHQKWKQFADLVGISDDEWLNFSKRWLTWFKDRNRLKKRR
jgi:Tc5 transposase DNA-binding domain